jgi:plasmid stabilization system protein ParE
MNVFVRDSACTDLEQIHDWIKRDRPDAADGVINRIFDSLEHLALFPFMGHPGAVAGTYEWVVPGIPFVIVYLIDEPGDVLTVVAIFHSRQDREFDIE